MNVALGSAALCFINANRLISLSAPDILIIVIYFVTVLGIGFYLKKFAAAAAKTSSWPAAI